MAFCIFWFYGRNLSQVILLLIVTCILTINFSLGVYGYENKIVLYILTIYITLGAYEKLKIISLSQTRGAALADHTPQIIIFLIICNLINIELTGPTFSSNFLVEPADRYRGIYVYSLLFILSIIHRHGIIKTSVIGMIGFILDGGRASAVMYVLLTQLAKYSMTRLYLMLFIFIIISQYTLAVSAEYLGILKNASDEIYIKVNAFNVAYQGWTILGNGPQDGRDPASLYGFHFLPADAAILGSVYEIGLLIPLGFVITNFILLGRLLSLNFSSQEKKLIISFFLVSLGYNMTSDLGANAIGLFLLVSILSKCRSNRT